MLIKLENRNGRSHLPRNDEGLPRLPVNLGKIEQSDAGSSDQPLVLGEQSPRLKLGRLEGSTSYDERHPEVAGAAFKIDDVKVLGWW